MKGNEEGLESGNSVAKLRDSTKWHICLRVLRYLMKNKVEKQAILRDAEKLAKEI